MKKKLLFEINQRLKDRAKMSSRKNKMLFGDFSALVYENGVRLNEFCRTNNLKEEEVFFYLESCIDATKIRNATPEGKQ